MTIPLQQTGQFALTDAAVAQILKRNALNTNGLRISIKGGGCSGLTYVFGWSIIAPDDETFERNGACVFIDRKSFVFLRGTVLDYDDNLLVRNFVLRNPNVVSTCGCGASFGV
jgi:iron-sulfur cluster assembly protein